MSWLTFNLQDFSVSFLSILFEGVPFMFIGTLLSGIIDAFVPPAAMTKFLPRDRVTAIALSGVIGVFFPMCECGVVPVIRRMIRKGLPVSCALTYLLAAPIVNPVVAISTFAAFRGQNPAVVTTLRLLMGFAIAFVCGVAVQTLPLNWVLNSQMLASPSKRRASLGTRLTAAAQASLASGGNPAVNQAAEADLTQFLADFPAGKTFVRKLVAAICCEAFDFLDVGIYLIVGAAIASIFNTAVHRDAILPLAGSPLLATAGLMLLALLLSLCSTSDAFIAASFITFPLAPKLAFMVLGPMMDIKLLFMYGLVFRKRFTASFALALFLLIGALCLGLDHFR